MGDQNTDGGIKTTLQFIGTDLKLLLSELSAWCDVQETRIYKQELHTEEL